MSLHFKISFSSLSQTFCVAVNVLDWELWRPCTCWGGHLGLQEEREKHFTNHLKRNSSFPELLTTTRSIKQVSAGLTGAAKRKVRMKSPRCGIWMHCGSLHVPVDSGNQLQGHWRLEHVTAAISRWNTYYCFPCISIGLSVSFPLVSRSSGHSRKEMV